MSEEPTERLSDGRPFEERVLAELAALNNRMAVFERLLVSFDGRLTSFDGRMNSLEEKVDSRLRETRPIWEAVLSRLELMDSKFDVLASDMLEMRGEINRLKRLVPPAA